MTVARPDRLRDHRRIFHPLRLISSATLSESRSSCAARSLASLVTVGWVSYQTREPSWYRYVALPARRRRASPMIAADSPGSTHPSFTRRSAMPLRAASFSGADPR